MGDNRLSIVLDDDQAETEASEAPILCHRDKKPCVREECSMWDEPDGYDDESDPFPCAEVAAASEAASYYSLLASMAPGENGTVEIVDEGSG